MLTLTARVHTLRPPLGSSHPPRITEGRVPTNSGLIPGTCGQRTESGRLGETDGADVARRPPGCGRAVAFRLAGDPRCSVRPLSRSPSACPWTASPPHLAAVPPRADPEYRRRYASAQHSAPANF